MIKIAKLQEIIILFLSINDISKNSNFIYSFNLRKIQDLSFIETQLGGWKKIEENQVKIFFNLLFYIYS